MFRHCGERCMCFSLSPIIIKIYVSILFSQSTSNEFLFLSQQKRGKNGIRMHWRGNAAFILGKCKNYDSNSEYLEMSETKVDNYFFFVFKVWQNHIFILN